MKNQIEFWADEEGVRLMASFIAQLIREGINFTVDHVTTATAGTAQYIVKFSGGY